MNAAELLSVLRRRGVKPWASAAGDTLHLEWDGPELEPELVAECRHHKQDLIAILIEHRRDGPGRYRCAGCWAWFPEVELTVVDERVGKGFRCVDCLR